MIKMLVVVIALFSILTYSGVAFAADVVRDVSDVSLDQKITYKAESKSLPAVLSEISQKTGVKFKAASGTRFWQVRQRKVSLYIKDMPLRELMNQLEKLLDYHFSRSGKPGDYSYTLWQDLNGRNRELNALKAQEELVKQNRRRAVDETLRDAELALMISPENVDEVKKSNLWLAYLAGTPRGRAYSQLLLSIPVENWDILLQGKEGDGFYLDTSKLSAQGQEAVKKLNSLIDYKQVRDIYKEFPEGDHSLTSIHVSNPHTDGDNPTPSSPFWLTVQSSSSNEPTNHFGVDTFMIARRDVSMPDDRMWPGLSDDNERQARAELSQMLEKTAQNEEKPDPDMERTANYDKVERREKKSTLSFELENVADLFDFNVLYECYPVKDNGTMSYSGERRLGDVLQHVASDNSLEWTKVGTTIRFRHVDWMLRRSWEIPVEWVRDWQKIIEKNNGLEIDTMVDIAARMTDDQIDRNFRPNGGIPSASIDNPLVVELFSAAGVSDIKARRRFLEMYGRLDASKKAKLWSKDGLPFDEIADDPIWQGSAPTIGSAPVFDAVLCLSQSPVSSTESSENNDTVYLTIKMKIWLRDIPVSERDRVTEMVSADALAKADETPLEIVNSGHALTSVRQNRVKQLIEQIKKQREER